MLQRPAGRAAKRRGFRNSELGRKAQASQQGRKYLTAGRLLHTERRRREESLSSRLFFYRITSIRGWHGTCSMHSRYHTGEGHHHASKD